MYAYVRVCRPHIRLNIVYCAHLKRNTYLKHVLFLNAKSPSLIDTQRTFRKFLRPPFPGYKTLRLSADDWDSWSFQNAKTLTSLYTTQALFQHSRRQPTGTAPKGDEHIQHPHIRLFIMFVMVFGCQFDLLSWWYCTYCLYLQKLLVIVYLLLLIYLLISLFISLLISLFHYVYIFISLFIYLFINILNFYLFNFSHDFIICLYIYLFTHILFINVLMSFLFIRLFIFLLN